MEEYSYTVRAIKTVVNSLGEVFVPEGKEISLNEYHQLGEYLSNPEYGTWFCDVPGEVCDD
jgi:hypothetical protein